MAEPALTLKNVSKSYLKKTALKDISLEIQAGQRVAVLGPTGAGKSTLLKICAGIEVPDSGEIEIFGTSPDQIKRRPKSRLIGLMHQHFDLVPDLKVLHNIQAGYLGSWNSWQALLALLLPIENSSARKIAETLNIDSLLHQKTADLSGGEKQRTAFARILLQNPEIMLLDEPVASLDPVRADDLLKMTIPLSKNSSLSLQSENGRGRTFIISLHIPDLAVRFTDRAIGIRQGQIIFDMPSQEINPSHLESLYSLAKS